MWIFKTRSETYVIMDFSLSLNLDIILQALNQTASFTNAVENTALKGLRSADWNVSVTFFQHRPIYNYWPTSVIN